MAERSERLLLLAILVVAVALRIPWMFESLWFDELYTSKQTLGTFTLLLKTLYSDIHPPAYFGFMYAWTQTFGDSELALRTPPLLCGLATIWLTYAVGRQFLGGRTGLVAAAIMATAPVHIWYSTEARPYSAQLVLLMMSVFAFGKLHEQDVLKRWKWLYASALFVLVFTHYYMAAYAVAFGALAFFDRSLSSRKWILGTSVVCLGGMAAYVGLKLYVSELETARGYLRAFTPKEWWLLFFDWFLTGHSLTPDGAETSEAARYGSLYGFQALAVIAMAFGLRRILAPRRASAMPRWHLLAHGLWLPLFLLALTLLGLDKTFIERSALPAYPFFVLMVAAGLGRHCPRLIVAGFALLQGITLVMFVSTQDLPTVFRPNPDWRGAVEYFATERDAGNRGAWIYTPYKSPDVLTYYDPALQQQRLFEKDDRSAQRLLSAFSPNSFPSSLAHDLIQQMIDEFETSKTAAAESMEMTVEQFYRRDPRQVPDSERELPFYVVYPGNYDNPETMEILADPRIEEVERRSWRWLRLHKCRYVEG